MMGETNCRQLKHWQMYLPDNRHLTVSVNVSVAQLKQSVFLRQLDHILTQTFLLAVSVASLTIAPSPKPW